MSEPLDIRKLIDASRAAAERTHVDLDVANKALDAISAGGAERLFDLWAAIDEQIGKAEAPGLQQQLIDLRARFIDEMTAAEVTRLEKAFKQSSDAGWNAWLSTLAEAIILFRFGFSTRLCAHAFPFHESKKQALENIRQAVRCMYQGRWPEAYDQLDYLAGQDVLPDVTRARLLVMLGQIQLFQFLEAARAKELFDTAERLVSDDGRVLSALGDYWVREKDFEKAVSYYERAIEIAPGMPDGYIGMGEYFENEKQLETAEAWYRKAIASASGDNQGYAKLCKLYGRQELFKTHETELLPLMARAIAVNPEGEYQIYLDLGYIYEQNEQFDTAQQWYEKAIALDETGPGGYAAVARCYEKQKRFDEAEAAYKKAVEVAPECYDGYIGLTLLYEQQEKWQDALEWYKRVPPHRKEWAGIARARVGEMHWRLEHYTAAEEILQRELQTDPKNKMAKDVLEQIADDYYTKRGNSGAATRVYDELLEILGDSYRGDYHNRLGNLHYFYGENVRAAEEYRRAIAAEPDTAVFHQNLAKAYRQLKDYLQAEQELTNAFRIDQDMKAFNKQMALLRNAEGNDYYVRGNYREAVERYTRAIEFDPSDDVIHSNLGGAWEQLKEPESRTEALAKAIEAFRGAQSINATEEYKRHIERLDRKKAFASCYGEKALDWLHVVTPIVVEVAGNLIPYTEGSTQGALSDELSKHLTDMRARVQNHFGVTIPRIRVRGNETDLPDGFYIIMLMEIPLVSGNIALDQRFFPGPAEALASLGVTGKEATNPLTGGAGCWINQDDWQKVETAGLELWEVIEYLIRHLEAVVQHNLIEFLGHQEVAEILEVESSQTLEEMRTRPEKLTALTTVCRGLVAEGVPIKPFGEIYQVFDRLYSERASLQNIVERIRSLPLLRSCLPGNDEQYSILPLGPHFEAAIRNAMYHTASHAVLAMEPERCQNALTAVRNGGGGDRYVALIVGDAALRPFVRLLVELEFPHIPVLSRRELRTDLPVKTAGLIELEEEAARAKPAFRRRRQTDVSGGELEDRGQDDTPESNDIAITVFVNDVFPMEQTNADDRPIEDMFSLMQDGLFYELGTLLPEVRLEIDNTLKTNEFRFKLNSREYPPFVGLERDEFLVNDTVDRLRLLNIEGREAVNPANGSACAIVREEKASSKLCQQAGLTTWGPAGFLVLTLSAEIRKNAATFQTINATQYILDSLRAAFPELIDTALKRFSVEQFCLVLRNLLDEQISIRDLRSILESMLSIRGTTDVDLSRYIIFTPPAQSLCPVTGNKGVDDFTIADYANFVRTSLKRYISHKYTRGSNTLVIYLLDPDIERRIAEVDTQPLTDEEKASLKAAVGDEVGSLPPTAQNPVLLTTMDIRRTIRKLIETDFPNLAVLSYQELSPDLNIQPIARISWD